MIKNEYKHFLWIHFRDNCIDWSPVQVDQILWDISIASDSMNYWDTLARICYG